jgi:SNF2 family DNA or RNA helicase
MKESNEKNIKHLEERIEKNILLHKNLLNQKKILSKLHFLFSKKATEIYIKAESKSLHKIPSNKYIFPMILFDCSNDVINIKALIKDLEEFYGTEIHTNHQYQTIKITMSHELRKIYDTVKKQILAEIETRSGRTRLNLKSIFTRLIRLQQITAGFTVNPDGKVLMLKDQPKVDALIEEVDSIVDAEEAVIVWCKFRNSMDIISSRLNKKKVEHYYMSGDDNPVEKNKKWRGFQKSSTNNIFLGQVRAGGIGIELFKLDGDKNKSQHTIFFENEWALETRIQAEGRIDRIGQKSICRYNNSRLLC